MTGGVVLSFDPALDSALRALGELAAATCDGAGALRLIPHITLLIADGLDPAPFTAGLADLAATHARFPIRLGAVATFLGPEGVVYLAPSVAPAMTTLQSRALDLALGLGATPWAYMQAGDWTPHCTISHGLTAPQVGLVIAAVHAQCAGLAGYADALVPFTMQGGTAIAGAHIPLGGS